LGRFTALAMSTEEGLLMTFVSSLESRDAKELEHAIKNSGRKARLSVQKKRAK
jgi:hypothetical protein